MNVPIQIDIPSRSRRIYPLRDLGVAPENLRFGQAPDDDIPALAAALLAAGQLQPLTVRPGGRREKRAMALDGRRRLLAYGLLLEQGAIADDHPVEVFEETDPARQAAAVVLTNTAVPVHVADVIIAIGKMLKARLAPAAIAGALGYAEVEVRRLAALADLEATALQALRAGKLTLRQARLLARLGDREVQAEIAGRLLAGYAFPDYRVADVLRAGRIAPDDPRCALVGSARYAAAGGRIEGDLFGELPDTWLDADTLNRVWLSRAAGLAAGLAQDGLAVQVTVEPGAEAAEPLEPVGDIYAHDLEGEAREAWRELALTADIRRDALRGHDLGEPGADDLIVAHLRARLAADLASEPARVATLVLLRPAAEIGIMLEVYGPPPFEVEAGHATQAADAAGAGGAQASAAVPAVEMDGVSHALHEVRTDAATRVLIRGLADNPAAALVALVARLFDVLVLHQGRAAGGGALSAMAEAYGRPRSRVIEVLDGVVRQRLVDRREAWRRSERSVIAWVCELSGEDRLALLAELTALSLDLREDRTTAVRARARAEAVEIAALCGLEATRYWTPDEPFLRAHGKAQLAEMLRAMEADDPGDLKKEPLVTLVAQAAAERAWAPAWLSWRPEPQEQALQRDDPDAGAETDAPQAEAA